MKMSHWRRQSAGSRTAWMPQSLPGWQVAQALQVVYCCVVPLTGEAGAAGGVPPLAEHPALERQGRVACLWRLEGHPRDDRSRHHALAVLPLLQGEAWAPQALAEALQVAPWRVGEHVWPS